MQIILVLITFIIALGFLFKKLLWKPFLKKGDPSNAKPGKMPECGSCSYH